MRVPHTESEYEVDSAQELWTIAAQAAGGRKVDSALMTALLMPFPPIQFCSFDCRCEEITAAEYLGVRNLPLLGYDVTPVDSAARARHPVVWFSDSAAGCLWRDGAIERSAIFHAQRGNRGSGQHGKRAYALKSLRGLSRSRRMRHAEAVLNAVAAGMRPCRSVMCPGAELPVKGGFGKEAVSSLCHSWHEKTPLAVLTRSLERWRRQIEASTPVYGLFRKIANDREARDYAGHIEEFGDILLESLNDSVDCVKSRSLRTIGFADLRNIFYHRINAVPIAMDTMKPSCLTVALRACGVDFGVSAMLSELDRVPRVSDLSELIYLARSGSPAFRQLAALALGASESDSALSAVGQLLYDSDSWVSDCALQAFVARQDRRAGLMRVYDHVPDARFGSRDSLRPGILWSLPESPSDEVMELLARELHEAERPDSATIRAVAADRLFEKFPDEAAEVFASAAKSGPLETRKLARRYLRRIQAKSSEAVESNLRGHRGGRRPVTRSRPV